MSNGNLYGPPGGLRLELAGLVFRLYRGENVPQLDADHISQRFVTAKTPDVDIQVHWAELDTARAADVVFQDEHLRFSFDRDFRRGDVYVSLPAYLQEFILREKLEAFANSIILTYLLKSGRAVPIHACGVDDGGRGLVFAGPSDAGKTTLANLWDGRSDVRVLSDERLLLRRKEHGFWVYGTLLNSASVRPSPSGAPLCSIFFIRHAESNTLSPRSAKDGAIGLLTQSFPWWYHDLDMPYPLDFWIGLAQEVPCYDLGFRPGQEVVELVRGLT